jgi:predicted N-acetyltransferase YhbS
MRKSFRQADFNALADLWNEFHPLQYAIGPELLEFNTVKSPVFDWGLSQIEYGQDGSIQGFICIKRSAANMFKGPSIDQAHLSACAYRDPRVAVDLVAEAKRILRNRGINRLIFGQDSRHFWPGCPSDVGSICGFLMVEGFEEHGQQFDMERDLSDYVAPKPTPTEVDFRPLNGEEDVVAIRVFLEQEFPGRWHHDVMDKVRLEETGDCVIGAFQNGKAIGFALVQHAGQNCPIGGAVWKRSLGDNWGAIGPIGIGAALRGHGFGDALLSASCLHLKDLGVRKCIVDWTTLEDFYGRHGFAVSRRYKSSVLKLGD